MTSTTRLALGILTLCLAAMTAACTAGPTPGTGKPPLSDRREEALVAAWISQHESAGPAGLRPVAASWEGGGLRMHFTYLTGRDFCGSGGCTLLIHRMSSGRVERVGRLTVVQPPVSVLPTTTNGLPDLAVGIAGGGIEPGTAILIFDGATYPSNPTAPPARRAARALPGQAVITEAMVWPATAAPWASPT